MAESFPQESEEELVNIREETFAELDRRRRKVGEVDQEIAIIEGKLDPGTLRAKLLTGDTVVLQVLVSYRGEMRSALETLREKRDVLLRDLERARERLDDVNRDLRRLVNIEDKDS